MMTEGNVGQSEGKTYGGINIGKHTGPAYYGIDNSGGQRNNYDGKDVGPSDIYGEMYDRSTPDFRQTFQYASWEKILTDNRIKIVVITGAPGDGKTSLAIRASQSLKKKKSVLYFKDFSDAFHQEPKNGTVIILDNVFLSTDGEKFEERSKKISEYIETINDLDNSRLVLICNIFDLNKYNHDDLVQAVRIDMTDAYTDSDRLDIWYKYFGGYVEGVRAKIKEYKGFGFPKICSYVKQQKISFDEAVHTHYKTAIKEIIEPRGVRLAMFALVFSFENTQHGIKSLFDVLHELDHHRVSKTDAKEEAKYFSNIFFSEFKYLNPIIKEVCFYAFHDLFREAIWIYIQNLTLPTAMETVLQEMHQQFDTQGLLCFAAETGAIDILKYILEKGPHVKYDVTKCLKSSPADLKDLRCLCKSPVHIGVIHDKVDVVLLLLNESNIYSSQEHLNSSLLWACIRGRTKILEELLKKDADIEFVDENKWTPLMWSCAAGMVESVQTLIKQGADITRKNSEGNTPLIIACKLGPVTHASQVHDVVSELLGNMDVNTDGQNTVNAGGNNGYTALMWASKHGRDSIVESLLGKGADETVKNTNGETALMLAASNCHRKIQYMLLYWKDMCQQFVATAGYEKARAILRDGNLLILAGRPGEGMTTLASRLCYDYSQQGYIPVVYEKGQNIDLHELKLEGKAILVGDNYTDNRKTVDAISNTHDPLRKFVLIGKFQDGTLKEGHYQNCIVDISKMNIENPDRAKEDHLKMLKLLTIHKSTQELEEIVSKSPSCVAFPKAVQLYKQLYRKYKHCVDPVTYFTYPLHYFIGEMENMAETSDMEEWVYLLLSWGNCGDDDDEVVRTVRQLFPQVTSDVKEKLRQFIGGYVDSEIIETRERVYFSHPAIYDACLFVVDRKYPGFLWKHCEVVFPREKEQSHIRLPKLTVSISIPNTDMFLTQIVEDLKQGRFRHSLSHGVLRTQEKIDRLFTQLGERLNDIVKAKGNSGSFLYWVAQSDNQMLHKTVLDKLDLSQADVNRALIECIRTNQSKPFHLLRGELLNKIGHNYNSDLCSLLMAAVERDNLHFVNVIVRDMDDLLLINNDGNTALHLVCLTGNTEVVKYVISRSSGSTDLPGQFLRTPVMMAALKGHGQLYEYLADVVKCQLTGVDDNGDTILHLACVGGNLNIVKQLVTGGIINKNQRGQYGKTPLMIAAYCKHKEMFDWLLGQKCDIPALDFSINDMLSYGGVHHSTSLHVFLSSRELGIRNKVHSGLRCQRIIMPSSKGLEYGRTKLLVKHLEVIGSNMLFEDESGMSLLHTAANTGHLKLADFLLSNGNVDINIRDVLGRTPVMLAVAGGHGQMFDFLLDRGAELSLKDETSSGILHFACQGSNRSVIHKVMEHGFTDVNSRNDYMKTPLSYAVETGDKQIFYTLLNRGGDLSVLDRDQTTLLHLACKGGNLAIVEHLLSLGMFGIDAVNREHRTPLLVAAYSGYTDVCHHLICVGADLHIQDWDGNDVLLVAADQGMKELTECILMKSKRDVKNKDKSGKSALMKAAEKGHHEVLRVMIDHGGFDLSTRDHADNNILHVACIGGNVDFVNYILSQNIVDKNSTDRRGKTPVMRAAENGHRGVFDLFVREGCDLSVVDSDEDNILHVACIGGNVDIVKYILSQNIVHKNSRGRRGRTPVMRAAEKGHRGVLDLLVKEGCDLSVVDRYEYNILHVACIGGNVDIVKYILSENIVDKNSTDRRGRTPVMWAAENGHRGVVDLLVKKGCDLTVVDSDEDNILHVACIGGNVDIVKYILSQNLIDKNSRGRMGRTPVMRAEENGHRGVLDLFVKDGCDLSVVDRYEYNILHVACIGGNVDIVNYILSQNIVDKNSTDRRGRTPVMWAAEKGHRGVFDLLLREGCDLSVVDSDEDNILHVACIGGNVDIVKYILSKNIVDTNSRGRWGRTPVMMAKYYGHNAVVDLLRHHGLHD